MNLRKLNTAADRRKALEKELSVSLPNIGAFTLDEAIASSRNCENMIGVAQIPIGVAGPLRVCQVSGIKCQEVYVPLATTEGALVASVNRGCKAITQSGGAAVDTYLVGATRGSVFEVKNLAQNDALNTYLQTSESELQAVAKKTSHHLALKQIFSRGLGRRRYVRFVFDTQDAMGMNMATIAATALVRAIEEGSGARCISVAGNYDVDKKPSWLNVIEGRGRKAWAEVVIPKNVLAKTLKTTAKAIFDVWLVKCMIGSAMAGSMGFNAQYANVIAAIFLATGQDPGHIGEASCGITTCEVISTPGVEAGENLYMSVYLPDLMVGTVGGGTRLATQKEALSIMDAKNPVEFSGIIAAAALAGELSLLASLAEGSLAQAHRTLARGKK